MICVRRSFEHIQRLSLNYFDKTHQGRIINRADTDIESLDRIMTWGASQMLSSALTLVGVVVLMVQYDWRLCLAVSVVLGPLWIATRMFQIYGMRAYRLVREQSSRITASIAEKHRRRARGAGVRARRNEPREFSKSAGRLFRSLYRLGANLPYLHAVRWAALRAWARPSFLVTADRWRCEMKSPSANWPHSFFISGCSSGRSKRWAIFTTRCFPRRRARSEFSGCWTRNRRCRTAPAREPLAAIRGHVVFESVWFRYDTTPENQWVLRDISFRSEAGRDGRARGRNRFRQDEHHQSHHAILRTAARTNHD